MRCGVARSLAPVHTGGVQRLPALCLIPLTLGLGCGFDEVDGSIGEEGKVEFTYTRSCFFGCPLEQPLLVGTREEISLSSRGSQPGVTARVDAEEVASFTLSRTCFCQRGDDKKNRVEVAEDAHCEAPRAKVCEAHVQVQARAAGDAALELVNADGTRLDRTTIHVREAARAQFSDLGRDLDAVVVQPGERADVDVVLYDAQGRRLLAPDAVRWRTGDGDIAQVTAWLVGTGTELTAGLSVMVEGRRSGQTEVSVDVPGLVASLPVEVR